MSTDVNMSLEDIIKKRKRNKRPIKKNMVQPKTQHSNVPSTRSPIDARNKIISKRRNQFTDAREKLADMAKQKDARIKLQQLRSNKIAMQGIVARKLSGRIIQENFGRWPFPSIEGVFSDPARQVSVKQHLSSQKNRMPKKRVNKKTFLENRSIASRSLDNLGHRPVFDDYEPEIKPLYRTVDNDVIMLDVSEERFEPRKVMSDRSQVTNLKIVTHNSQAQDKYHTKRRPYEYEKERSPPRPPSILKKRPMAALRSEKKREDKVTSSEYRIIVSNLSNIVTGSDVEELFGGIGGLVESRLVRPGTAEVIYRKLEDAQRAVDLYHNRQLDGQPMNCLLVNPRPTNNNPTLRSSGIPASSSSNVEPDLSTFHKVLFSHL